MDLSPILTPDGQPIFTMGGGECDPTRPPQAYKEWVVSFEWFKGTRRGIQKCIVIWPQSRLAAPGAIAVGGWTISARVCQEFIGFDSEGHCTGLLSPLAHVQAQLALPVLGKDPNDKNALHSLLDVLTKFLPDLPMMKQPPAEIRNRLLGPPMWDVIATNKHTGKVIDESSR